jgi:hypothetical protein
MPLVPYLQTVRTGKKLPNLEVDINAVSQGRRGHALFSQLVFISL